MKRAWMVGALLLGCGARTGEAFPLGVNRSTGDGTASAADANGTTTDVANAGRGGETATDAVLPAGDGRMGRRPDGPGGGPRRPSMPGRPTSEPAGTAGSSSGGSPDPALMPVDEPPTFDTCGTPLELPSGESTEASGTLAITASTNQSTCFENGADVFFRWTAPRTGVYVFFTTGTEFDSVLTLYSADCGNQLGCNDDAPGSMDLHAEVRAEVTEGASVVLVLSSYYDTSGGNYRVGVSPE